MGLARPLPAFAFPTNLAWKLTFCLAEEIEPTVSRWASSRCFKGTIIRKGNAIFKQSIVPKRERGDYYLVVDPFLSAQRSPIHEWKQHVGVKIEISPTPAHRLAGEKILRVPIQEEYQHIGAKLKSLRRLIGQQERKYCGHPSKKNASMSGPNWSLPAASSVSRRENIACIHPRRMSKLKSLRRLISKQKRKYCVHSSKKTASMSVLELKSVRLLIGQQKRNFCVHPSKKNTSMSVSKLKLHLRLIGGRKRNDGSRSHLQYIDWHGILQHKPARHDVVE